MKKRLRVYGALALIIVFVFYFFVFTDNSIDGELNIYNWDDYFSETTLEDFEKEYGVKVNLYTYEDEYEILENLEDLSQYDVVVVSDDLVNVLIDEEMLEKINTRKIPNAKKIYEGCYNERNFRYVVPYFIGTTGIAYNSNYVDEIDSWKVFFSNKYYGKKALLDNPAEVFAATSKYIGNGLVPRNIFELKEVNSFFPYLEGVSFLDSYSIIDLLESEEVWIGQVYTGDVEGVIDVNEDIKYVIPKEGTSKWVDSFVIMKSSQNKKLAEVFLNYILREDVIMNISDYQQSQECYISSKKEVSNVFYDFENNNFLEYFSDYNQSNEIREKMISLFNELKERQNE